MESGITHSAQRRFLVIDDHEAILEGTVPALQTKYPTVEILTAKCQREAEQRVRQYRPEFVVVDLSLPESPAAAPSTEVGQQFSFWQKAVQVPEIPVL